MKPGKKPFISKVCPVCGIDKPRSEYYKKGSTVSHKCKPCSLSDCKRRAPKYFGKYAEYQNEWRRNMYASDPFYRERVLALKKAGYDLEKDSINLKRRLRWLTDPNNPARLYYRRKDIKTRTPKWAKRPSIQRELLRIYAACPVGMEVDHIIPLKGIIDGREVCGLHIPCNLQYLSPTENRKKKNLISEKDISHLFKR